MRIRVGDRVRSRRGVNYVVEQVYRNNGGNHYIIMRSAIRRRRYNTYMSAFQDPRLGWAINWVPKLLRLPVGV